LIVRRIPPTRGNSKQRQSNQAHAAHTFFGQYSSKSANSEHGHLETPGRQFCQATMQQMRQC
jgi:hypothetical protein